jgi:hypothetical protein
MCPRVILEPNRPSEEIIPNTVGWERTQEIGKMRRVLIDVERSQAQSVTLNRKDTLVELEGVDTVRLVDVETGGPTWTLVCYSLEWNANVEPPTPGGQLREGDDQTLITNLASNTQFWDAGTIGNFTSALSFVFNHAQPHEILRRIERNVPGEIQFRDTGTVDYVDRLGSDKSGSVELSASAGTIEDAITITERGRQLDGTHIRVLGAHEGEAQRFVNLVPDSDPATYENDVRYTTSRWSGTTDTDWDRWENKDITDQATLRQEAEALAQEITEPLVEAKTKTSTTDLSLGDSVQVVKPDADLDRTMRVHRVTTRAGGRTDSAGSAAVIDELLLSTRTTARNDSGKDLRSIRQFNTGFQGTSVVIQGGGSRQPVNSSNNAVVPFDYPEIEFENEATLQVRGLPYRAYSSGAASGGTPTSSAKSDDITAIDLAQSGDTIQVPPGGDSQILAPVDSGFQGDMMIFSCDFSINDSLSNFPAEDDVPVVISLQSPTVDLWDGYIEVDELGNWSRTVSTTEIDANEDFEMTIQNRDGSEDLYYDYSITGYAPDHEHTIDPHTHDADPGITEFASNTPSNVDVLINGTTVATDIGSGEFETEVDIGGELTGGAWNDIELTSDTLGHIQATVSIDGYKQIGKQ